PCRPGLTRRCSLSSSTLVPSTPAASSVLSITSRFNETVLTTLLRRSRALRCSSALRSIRIVPV
ncbi:hypothetical protein K440DRAFT_609260, partial [Wilcoxina mikolae CBS 423.85]